MRISKLALVFLIAILSGSGCATVKKVGQLPVNAVKGAHDKWSGQPRVKTDDRRLERATMSQAGSAQPTLDSYPSLVSDHRATGVGQSVTVLVLERASSTTSADTRTRSAFDATARLDQTFRFDEGGVDVDGRSVGAGSISREGELVASVSAVVTDVLPGGDLVLYGEQSIEVNDETQYIRVAGRVRPEDISGDNTVLSTRMADAQIMYKGYGILAESQEPGVLTRIFNWIF